MSLAVFVQPKTVRILDGNSKPMDILVIEFPFWLAKTLCDSKVQSTGDLQQELTSQLPFSVYYSPEGQLESSSQYSQYSQVDGFDEHQPQTESMDLNEHTFILDPQNYDPNVNYFIEPTNMQLYQQDHQSNICVPYLNMPSTATTSQIYSGNSQIDHQDQIYDSPLVEQNYISDQTYSESLVHNHHNYAMQPPMPKPRLPVVGQIHDLPPFMHRFEDPYSRHVRDNFQMLTGENGSFFIGNELSETSGFVSSNLQDWGFSHPLGQVHRNRRNLSCCFILHSGTFCYVKFTPIGIKFSSKLNGISYLIDEAGVRTCVESFKSFDDLVAQNDAWKSKTNQPFKANKCKPCCSPFDCLHQDSTRRVHVAWNSESKDETIRIEREGLRFFSETRELQNLNLSLNDYYLSSTLQHVGERVGHIYVKSFQHRFKQSVFFNGKSLQVKFHTQSARLNSYGELSLRD